MHNKETLPLLLKQLHLPCMYAHWEQISLQAEKERWEYPVYLATLANRELINRQQNRIERRIKESRLPPGKTLDSFDFTISQSVNAAQITALANNIDWINRAENLMIFGPSGVGKTHLVAAIGCRLSIITLMRPLIITLMEPI